MCERHIVKHFRVPDLKPLIKNSLFLPRLSTKPKHVFTYNHRCETATRCGSTNLGESGGRHLYSAFIRGVNLKVVSVGAVQPQQPAAWEASVVTWRIDNDSINDETVLHPTCFFVCARYLALLDTCSGRPFQALQPALGQRGSTRLPTSALAAKTDLPCVCLRSW